MSFIDDRPEEDYKVLLWKERNIDASTRERVRVDID